MAGLVPAIRALLPGRDVDARHKAGHDEAGQLQRDIAPANGEQVLSVSTVSEKDFAAAPLLPDVLPTVRAWVANANSEKGQRESRDGSSVKQP